MVANQPVSVVEGESGRNFHVSEAELSPFFKISCVSSQGVLEMVKQRVRAKVLISLILKPGIKVSLLVTQ